ncbi:MAG: alpha/beta hydrolase [Cyclobacteriaceae bacterium]|nr:alpha/beta hydrolase [Cyclobacteriaceae bacterium]
MQDKFIFQGTPLKQNFEYSFNEPFKEHDITMSDGVVLNVLHFISTIDSKGLILYFHGNADNLSRWGTYAPDFTKLGYDVLMMDYRGYGKSGGVPTEQLLYKDAEELMRWTNENIKHDRLVIYGRSLGAAVASHLASEAQPYKLILETPFDEIGNVAHPVFYPIIRLAPQRFVFSNKEHLKKVEAPVVVIHGTDDWIVPLSSAEKLRPFLKPGDEFVIIEGGGHHDLNTYPEFHRVLERHLW